MVTFGGVTGLLAAETSAPPFAVVELFTSEGCSSCPPADRVLAEIVEDAKKSGKRIFPLAFHVDYWNHLGWEDPFSLAIATKRQRAYGSVLSSNRLYTPQMVVNGTEEFVGSDRGRARKEIDAALARPAKAKVTLHSVADAGRWKIAYEVSGETRGADLYMALVESGLVTQVKRGENAGHTLTHVNVVRSLQSISLDKTSMGDVHVENPGPLHKRDIRFIAFVQERDALRILGASEIVLGVAESK